MSFIGSKIIPKKEVPLRSDCHPGDLIEGRYRVECVLGEGAFGCVYKVVDATRKMWALKLLRLWDVPADIRQQLIDRFEMEFKTGLIPSRNLVHSVDFGYLKGNPFIVMEFCDGGNLGAKIGDCNADITRYAKDILNGLSALHKEGKVHRDLKPENVLLRSDGTAVLTDFGISGDRNKRMTERNIFGKPCQIFGTYAYMPPEQVNRGRSTVIPTTDIFSFGIVIYQLITGVLPFGKLDDQNDLVRYQKRGAAGDWDRKTLLATSQGSKWYRLMEGCLQPDYKQRLQNTDEVMRLVPYNSMPVFNELKVPELKTTGDRVQLVVMQGIDYGRKYDLSEIIAKIDRKIITCGRDVSNVVKLNEYNEPYISRRHFTIERNMRGEWLIRDGQWIPEQRSWKTSVNGTFVNSDLVKMNGVVMKDGDIISVGDVKLKFEVL